MNKLDEISRIIGGVEAQLKNINARMTEDRELADDRHRDNTENLEQIGGRVENLERTVTPVAETVASWKPILDKMPGALWLAGIILTLIGTALALIFQKFGDWMLSLLHLR